MFDDLKRSNGIRKLAAWHQNGLLTDEELVRFSDETAETVGFSVDPSDGAIAATGTMVRAAGKGRGEVCHCLIRVR